VTAALTVQHAGSAAELAAEAVRALNHLTLAPPSAGTPGWEDLTGLYRVLTELRILTERLPQAIDQLARHLGRPIGGGYRCDAGTDESPEALVAGAVGALETASIALQGAGRDLSVAQGALAHLAPRDATLAGKPSGGDGRSCQPAWRIAERRRPATEARRWP
jgi:hypothetical protein